MRGSIRNSILNTVNDLYKQGVVNEITLRDIESLCLDQIKPYSPTAIKKLRRRLRLSQAALAKFLNTSVSTIQKWEAGAKKPSGPALKLLSLTDSKGLIGII
ncbi:MAG: helix-turn-helix domain-containing protein [Proteobacteria bacterium]|nr:helix-turn-helix domain-containing protein [Pseudomonadota bacterium]